MVFSLPGLKSKGEAPTLPNRNIEYKGVTIYPGEIYHEKTGNYLNRDHFPPIWLNALFSENLTDGPLAGLKNVNLLKSRPRAFARGRVMTSATGLVI
jgi:hypothetical protein